MRLKKSDVILIVVVLVISVSLHPLLVSLSGTRFPLAVVRGHSMLPLLREGDIVFLVHRGPQDIRVGDIVVYRSLRGHLIIHRVIAIIKYGNEYEYVTKGDNNPRDDSFLFEYPPGRGVPYDRVIGVVWEIKGVPFKIPYLGAVTLLAG